MNLLLCPDQIYAGECANPQCGKGLHLRTGCLKRIRAECTRKGLQEQEKACRRLCNFHFHGSCKKGDSCTFIHADEGMIDGRRWPTIGARSCAARIVPLTKTAAKLVVAGVVLTKIVFPVLIGIVIDCLNGD